MCCTTYYVKSTGITNVPNVFTMVALLAENETVKTYRYHIFVFTIISEYRLRKIYFFITFLF